MEENEVSDDDNGVQDINMENVKRLKTDDTLSKTYI